MMTSAPAASSLEERFAIDIAGNRDAKILQYGWRDVHDGGWKRSLACDGPARDQHAGCRRVIESAVVAAPLLHIRVHDALWRSAKGRLPRHTIAVLHAD